MASRRFRRQFWPLDLPFCSLGQFTLDLAPASGLVFVTGQSSDGRDRAGRLACCYLWIWARQIRIELAGDLQTSKLERKFADWSAERASKRAFLTTGRLIVSVGSGQSSWRANLDRTSYCYVTSQFVRLSCIINWSTDKSNESNSVSLANPSDRNALEAQFEAPNKLLSSLACLLTCLLAEDCLPLPLPVSVSVTVFAGHNEGRHFDLASIATTWRKAPPPSSIIIGELARIRARLRRQVPPCAPANQNSA